MPYWLKRIPCTCKHLFILVCILPFGSGYAQKSLREFEDSLLLFQRKLYAVKNDREKLEVNRNLNSCLERALQLEKSFEYPFDSLTEIGRLTDPDRTFRIIEWDVPLNDGTHLYCGFIQSWNPKRKAFQLYPLIDKSADIKNPENYTGEAAKWYGMLYYKIIPVKSRGKKLYTLLGQRLQDKLTTKKIVDVLAFNSDGSPRFGADIFKYGKASPKRVVFEYSAQVVMSLKYDEHLSQIVFDHLSPSEPRFEGQHQYYGPDFSVDAFQLKKGKWHYVQDVDARNKSKQKEGKYNDPQNQGKEHEPKQFYTPKN